MRPATVTVIILSLIGGLRSFDLIWAMTRGGPGFTSDVIASVIYKQYQAGFYGLSTAGNVVLFVVVAVDHRAALVVAQPQRGRAMKARAQTLLDRRGGDRRLDRRLRRAVRLHRAHGGQGQEGGVAARLLAAGERHPSVGQPRRGHRRRATTCCCTAFINSIILTVVSVTLLVIFGAMVGFVLQRRPSRWTPVVNFLVLAGLIIPPAVVPTIWVLQGLDLFKTLHGMILIEVAYGLSFTVLLFRAFVATIPRELDEAAIMDGAGPLRLFFQVILPLLRPVVVTVIVVQSVAIFNDFTNPLYYLPGKENVTVQLTLYNFQSQFSTSLQPAVHEHPADHHPAADRLPVLQPADRRRHDRGRGQGLTSERSSWERTCVAPFSAGKHHLCCRPNCPAHGSRHGTPLCRYVAVFRCPDLDRRFTEPGGST